MKTEKQTRQDIIDKQLLKAGWNVTDTTQVIEEFEIDVARFSDTTTSNNITFTSMEAGPDSPYKGHQYSDYVLLGKDGKPIAVVEAKKTSKDATNARERFGHYLQLAKSHLNQTLPISLAILVTVNTKITNFISIRQECFFLPKSQRCDYSM